MIEKIQADAAKPAETAKKSYLPERVKYFLGKIEKKSDKRFLLGLRNMDKNDREREKARVFYYRYVPEKDLYERKISADDIITAVGAAYATHVYANKHLGKKSFPEAMLAYRIGNEDRVDRIMKNILSFDVKTSFNYMVRHGIFKKMSEYGLDYRSLMEDLWRYSKYTQQRWSKVYWRGESEEDLFDDEGV